MNRAPLKLRRVTAAVLAVLSHAVLAQSAQTTTVNYEYDANGNLTKVTDPLAHVTRYSYDALNRRTQATDANNGQTKFAYDGLDQLRQLIDPRNLATAYTVDGLGNQTVLASPDTGNTIRTYDEAGTLRTSTDARGQTTAYQYDVLNRLSLITYADGSTVTYRYDQGANAKGRLSHIVDHSGTIQYSYDLHGRVTQEVRIIAGQAATTAYRYDAAGRLSGMTYPSGRSVDYARDGAGRISRISATMAGVTQVLVSEVSYQPFGPVRLITFGNGRSSARSYDLDGRITGYTLNGQQQSISYDAASRISGIEDAANPMNKLSYGYDSLDRLTAYLTPAISGSYSYDAVGNRTARMHGVANTTYAYGVSNNRLTQVRGTPIGSDANGSMLASGDAQFSYDARGRLIAATTPVGVVRYFINGLGQRVQKVSPTEATIFHYDLNGKLIGEQSGQIATDYIYLGELPVAALR